MNKRAQSWSVDVVLAVVIFGFIAVSISSFALLDEPEIDKLQKDAQNLDAHLANPISDCPATIQAGVLDPEAAECLFSKNYTDLKGDLRTSGDFCIFIEDEQGTVIPIANKTGVGDGKVLVGGRPCGQ